MRVKTIECIILWPITGTPKVDNAIAVNQEDYKGAPENQSLLWKPNGTLMSRSLMHVTG